MTTGANFKVVDGRIQWWESLIMGDELLTQDHEARAHARQGTYLPCPEYGDPFVDTLSSEISETERNMRLGAEMKQCVLQDARFADCIVDQESIVIEEGALRFEYEIFKKDGGSLVFEF